MSMVALLPVPSAPWCTEEFWCIDCFFFCSHMANIREFQSFFSKCFIICKLVMSTSDCLLRRALDWCSLKQFRKWLEPSTLLRQSAFFYFAADINEHVCKAQNNLKHVNNMRASNVSTQPMAGFNQGLFSFSDMLFNCTSVFEGKFPHSCEDHCISSLKIRAVFKFRVFKRGITWLPSNSVPFKKAFFLETVFETLPFIIEDENLGMEIS